MKNLLKMKVKIFITLIVSMLFVSCIDSISIGPSENKFIVREIDNYTLSNRDFSTYTLYGINEGSYNKIIIVDSVNKYKIQDTIIIMKYKQIY